MDRLVRFELYQDPGGRDLVEELSGRDTSSGTSLEEAALSVTDSQTYSLVLWYGHPGTYHGWKNTVDAQLALPPARVRE